MPCSRRTARPVTAALAAALVLAACSDDPGPTVETADVTAGEVVQTIAAVAELEPAGRVAVTAPVGGEVVELLVADGDTIEAGDPVARLASDSIELQIAQAEAAVDAADALAGSAGAAGLDLSPIFGAFAGQLDATLPPILDTLRDQTVVIEDDDLREAAEERLGEARRSYEDAAGQLRDAERDAAGQAQAATDAQAAAAAAQRRQAELALEAAESRGDELVVVSPADGVVELGRADAGGAAPDLGGLAGQLGGAGGGAGDAGDVGALLGGGGSSSAAPAGPVAEGVSLAAGATIATVYDLSSFTARVDVDEIDVVEVAEEQAVTVLVDAFPDAELRGTVDHVALAPTAGAAGGAIFPVTVRLTEVPDDVQLRVGLTASAEVEVRRIEADAVVPTAALLRRGGDEVVFVVDPDPDADADDGARTVREVAVTVAALGEDTAAVEGELVAGDVVVTAGVETVSDGDVLPAS